MRGSDLLSRRHYRRWFFRSLGHARLPSSWNPSLHARYALRCYDGSSDSRASQSPARVSLLHVPHRPDVPTPTTRRRPIRLSLGCAESVLTANHGVPATGVSRRSVRHVGFALSRQARRDDRPNRVHLRFGPPVRLAMLPTPPLGDAVSTGYRLKLIKPPDKDLHLADPVHLQTHWQRLSAGVAARCEKSRL